MRPASQRYTCCLFLLLISLQVSGQVKKKIREYEKGFQFSLFPGISTNGISSASYFNSWSFNLFGGISAGNRILEIGLITNSSVRSTTGIQLAGFGNIVGTNSFLNLSQSEERTLIGEDYESNSKGIQFAGILNYVRNNASGIQVTGGFNAVGDNFKGIQLAGFGNSAGGFTVGLQLAGIYNVSKESIGGFQISSLFNYTDAQLSGIQIGLINKARTIKGHNSTPPTRAKGIQIGLLNFSKAMDGTQIGLINVGGDARGKQFGLINFFSKYGSKENVRMGTPVGLFNKGSRGSYFRLYYNELFVTNIEYTTGNCLNCTWTQSTMPYDDRFQIFNQNALILGYDPFNDTWGFGWGFQKVLYNKSSMLPSDLGNKKHQLNYGIKFIHLNRSLSFDKAFNLVNRINLGYGKRIRSFYLVAGISINYFLHEEGDEGVYKVKSSKVSTGKLFELGTELWPGYEIALQF